MRVALLPIAAAGGYAFLVSVQVINRIIGYRKYVELLFDDIVSTTPTASIAPLDIRPVIRWELQALGTTRCQGSRAFIPDALVEYLDHFIDNYASVNRIH